MTKNPFLNALGASVYIGLVVLLMNVSSNIDNSANELVVASMMLSLFTLSVAVMGYIFFYEPFKMYLDGKKEEAVKLFLQTVGIFGGINYDYVWIVFLRVF
jgi:hypothetical protein